MAVTTAGSSVTTDPEAPEPRPRSSSWVIQVTALSLLLGCFLGVALQAQRALRDAGLPSARYAILMPYFNTLKDANAKLQQELTKEREKTSSIQAQMAQGIDMTAAMKKDLQNLQMQAGQAAVHGPGLIITLRDRKELPPDADPAAADAALIHDQDLALVLNELKASGAEAIAVAGNDGPPQRIILNSAPRCAGPIIQVNGTPLAGPYTIWVIGDPRTLESAMKLPGGVVDKLQLSTLGMIEFKQAADIKIPAYSGSISFKYAKPAQPPDTKKQAKLAEKS
jgi:uncharacterized protein YlxW (UPF0749 family)